MNKEKIKIGGESVLYFNLGNNYSNVFSIRFGDTNNIFELDLYVLGNEICSGVCALSNRIEESDYELPDINDLEKKYIASYFSESGPINVENAGSFSIIYNQKDMHICFKPKSLIKSYYELGRLILYYDDKYGLCDIRIKDLTEEEYNFLKQEELNPGSYLSNNSYGNDESKYDIIDIDEQMKGMNR